MDYWSRHELEREFDDSRARQIDRAVSECELPGSLRAKLEPLGIKFLKEDGYLVKVGLPKGWVLSNEHTMLYIRDGEGKEKAILYVKPANNVDTEWGIVSIS